MRALFLSLRSLKRTENIKYHIQLFQRQIEPHLFHLVREKTISISIFGISLLLYGSIIELGRGRV